MSRGISVPRHPSWTRRERRLQRRSLDHVRATERWVEEARKGGYPLNVGYPMHVSVKFAVGLHACAYMLIRTSGRAAATWNRRAGILRGELERGRH